MSPDPGIFSSDTSAQKNELRKALVRIAESLAIRKIIGALGPDAKLHIVGGIFRNFILEQSPGDLDLATLLKPEEVVTRLAAAGIKTYPTGISHGTLTALSEETSFEITTFREPGSRMGSNYSESILKDLSGRDFTINAIAFDIESSKIIDPYEGISATANLILKTVLDPQARFIEDPLRILRAARFIATENFSPDDSLTIAAKNLSKSVLTVSPERITSEFCKIITGRYVRKSFEWMHSVGLIELLLPEIIPCMGFEQNKYHTEDVYNHTLSVIENSHPAIKVRLAALFHDLGKPQSLTLGEEGQRHFYNHEDFSYEIAKDAFTRFKFSNDLTDSVLKLVKLHMRPIQCGPAGVRRLMRDLGTDFADWLLLKRADKTPVQDVRIFDKEFNDFISLHLTEVEKQKNPVYGKLAINGDDLIAMGVPKGKMIGKILRQIEDDVIENPDINQKPLLIERARKLYEG